MKLESWNAHMSNTLRNRRMDMIELLLLENELHKSLNAPGALKDEENASLTLAKILEVQSKLKDMQEQYDCFWGKYEKKNAELIKRAKSAADETGGSTIIYNAIVITDEIPDPKQPADSQQLEGQH